MKQFIISGLLLCPLILFSQKTISHYNKTIGKIIVLKINGENAALSYIAENTKPASIISIKDVDLKNKVQFKYIFVQLANRLYIDSPTTLSGKSFNLARKKLIRRGFKKYYHSYIRKEFVEKEEKIEEKKTLETDTGAKGKKDDNSNTLSSPFRITFGVNSNDIPHSFKGTFYGRLSYFTDDIYNRDSNKRNPTKFGLYASFFRQTFQIKETLPGTLIVNKSLRNLGSGTFGAYNEYYIRDTAKVQLEQTGFLVSPSIMLASTEKYCCGNNRSKKNKNHCLSLNFDLEYSYLKYTNLYTDRKIGYDSSIHPLSEISNFSNWNEPTTNDPYINIHQVQYGVGLTYSFKSEDIEFILKPTIGGRSKLVPISKPNFYNSWYYSISHRPTGFRIGGDIRSYFLPPSQPKTYDIYFSLFAGFVISFDKLAGLFQGN